MKGQSPAYQPSHSSGGRVAAVAQDSPASLAGLVVGDIVLAVEGAPVADVIDWQWFSSESEIALTVRRDDASVEDVLLSRDDGVAWGIEFSERLFDGIRTCRNDCEFCFVAQLPSGLRKPLYVRDDDFRLSFLDGNFITLTNLVDADITRIVEQRLSPLYISLHSVHAEIRERLIAPRDQGNALKCFDELIENDIELHVQIVLVPKVNDDGDLDATLTWLASRPGVVSVGIVPVGYTRFGAVRASYEDQASAAAILDQLSGWQEAHRSEHGTGWVYAADEFYLAANRPVPSTEAYDGFPQSENGIGLVRQFEDAWRAALSDSRANVGEAVGEIALLTGTLFGPVLHRLVSEVSLMPDTKVRVLPVDNVFFGGNVSVTGLLTGEDLTKTILAAGAETTYVLPNVIFNADGVTLDEMSLDDIREASGARIRLVSCDAASLLDTLQGRTDPVDCG